MSVSSQFAGIAKSDVLWLENGPGTKLHSKYFQCFRNPCSTSKPEANVSISPCGNTNKINVLIVMMYFRSKYILKSVFLQFPLFWLHCKIQSYLIICLHCSSVATLLCATRCWLHLRLCIKKSILSSWPFKNMLILRLYFVS